MKMQVITTAKTSVRTVLRRIHLSLPVKLAALSISASFFVTAEPAPADMVFFFAALAYLIRGRFCISAPMTLLRLICAVLFLTGTVSLTCARDASYGAFYLGITSYLMASSIVYGDLIAINGRRAFDLMHRSFIFASLVSSVVVLGIIVFIGPSASSIYRAGEGVRLAGTFKDPNVFGPFLVTGCLFVLADERGPVWGGLAKYVIFLMLSICILLTFSRAAWGSLIVALTVFYLLKTAKSGGIRRVSTRIASLLMLGLLLATAVELTISYSGYGDMFTRRFAIQEYDYTERLVAQQEAIGVIADTPFGIGPGNFTSASTIRGSPFIVTPHNTYLKMTAEHGWLGGVAFVAFLLLIGMLSLRGALRSADYSSYYAAYFAVWLTLTGSCLVIDTFHWRHLFVVAGLAVGLTALEMKEARQALVNRLAPQAESGPQ